MSYSNNKLKKSIEEKIEHLFKPDDLKVKKKNLILHLPKYKIRTKKQFSICRFFQGRC